MIGGNRKLHQRILRSPSLPKRVLDLFPMWQYRCPTCGRVYDEQPLRCFSCLTLRSFRWRIPPLFLRNREVMSKYAHEVLAPKLTKEKRELLFRYFTIIFEDDFESGDFTAWSGTSLSGGCSITAVTTKKYCGDWAAQAHIIASGNVAVCYFTHPTALTDVYARCYALLASLPPVNTNHSAMMSFYTNVPNIAQKIAVRMSGGNYQLMIRNAPGPATYSSGTIAIQAGDWHCYEMRVLCDNAAGIIQGWYDGELLINQAGIDTKGASNIKHCLFGHNQSNWIAGDIFIDCCVLSDSRIYCCGFYLNGEALNVWHNGFSEIRDLVRSEYPVWDTTLARVARHVHPFGSVRSWRLRCFEEGVDWASSIVTTLQGMVDDNTVVPFLVDKCGLHDVLVTDVKVLSVDLEIPKGSDTTSRNRNFIVTLQEIP